MWLFAVFINAAVTLLVAAAAGVFFFLDASGVAPKGTPWQIPAISALAFTSLIIVGSYFAWGWKVHILTVGRPRLLVRNNDYTRTTPFYLNTVGTALLPSSIGDTIQEFGPHYQYHITELIFYNSPKEHRQESAVKDLSGRMILSDGTSCAVQFVRDASKPDDVGPIGSENVAFTVDVPAGEIPAKLPFLAKFRYETNAYLCHPNFWSDVFNWRREEWVISPGMHQLRIRCSGNNLNPKERVYWVYNPGVGDLCMARSRRQLKNKIPSVAKNLVGFDNSSAAISKESATPHPQPR